MSYKTVDEFRADLIASGDTDLAEYGDGELEDAMRLGEQDAEEKHHLDALYSLAESLKKLSSPNVSVSVDSAAMAEAAKSLQTTTEAMLTVYKNMGQVTVENEALAKGLNSLAVALEKTNRPIPRPKVTNRVEAPSVHVNVDPITKALSNLVTLLSEAKAPVVTVAGPRIDAPVIHVHVPRIKEAVQALEFDSDGQVIGSRTTYEYYEE